MAGLLLSGSVLAQGSFTNLGVSLSPSAVSADGSVVAGTDAVQYFRWTAGTGVVPVGGVSAAQGGVGGSATPGGAYRPSSCRQTRRGKPLLDHPTNRANKHLTQPPRCVTIDVP
jgi:hypothetical protein